MTKLKSKFTPKKDRIEYGGAMIDEREITAILKVIQSQGGKRWTIGPQSKKFEQELASTTGVKRAVVVNSGSSALLVAMTSLHLPKGSKVIIPALTFPTAFNAILQTGGIPVIVDINPHTLNLDFEEVKVALKKYNDIAAVVAVDIAGNPVDLIELRKIVGKDVKIVLDDCDGYGTTLKGKFIETYADISAVSFHAAHIITTGEGGAVLTNSDVYADRAIKIREWGRASGTDKIYKYPGFPEDYKERYVYEEIGYNVKPLELQCAMGRIQLKRLASFKKKRKAHQEKMASIFSKYTDVIQLTECTLDAEPCWFSFAILCTDIPRSEVMETLEKNNIETRTIFSGNITRHPAYKDTKYYQIGDLYWSDYIMKNGLFLSCHPSLIKEQFDFIDKVIGNVVEEQRPSNI